MPLIHSVNCAFPSNYYSQSEILGELSKVWKDHFQNFDRIVEIQKNSSVEYRHLCLPIEKYLTLKGFKEKNDYWIKHALALSQQAILGLLEKNGLNPGEIDLLVSSTVTGLSVPTLDAKLFNLIPFKANTKRLPIFGLGCLAGVAGLNRTVDYLKGHPKDAAIFFTTELCSLTFQFNDFSIPNVISTALFADGCAAVLLLGDEHPLSREAKLKIVDGESRLFPNTENIMGWDYVDSGPRVVLNAQVPDIVRNFIPPIIMDFAKKNGINVSDIRHFLSHPGGPKVLEALSEAMQLDKQALKLSWDCLKFKGNMSSVSVLYILSEFLQKKIAKEEIGLLLALGPAFCAEATLFKVVG